MSWIRQLLARDKEAASMRCPSCLRAMTARQTAAEMHVDPSGYGVYECRNPECQHKPRYRRVDIQGFMEATDDRPDSAIQKQREESQGYRRLARDESQLTAFLRDMGWRHLLDGRYPSITAAVISILRDVRTGAGGRSDERLTRKSNEPATTPLTSAEKAQLGAGGEDYLGHG